MSMTPESKRALSTSIRSLRARLLEDLHAATESAYRLSVRARDAGLDEQAVARRRRLEDWVKEQLRVAEKAASKAARNREDFRREAEKQAAYTLLNRLVLLRLMEVGSAPLRAPAVVTGGWESRGYEDFRQLAPGLVRGDETEGYAWLLQSVFEDLATELPGLYGSVGVVDLIPVPAATLRHVIDALNEPELESCWTDDMTLGWVYQYWNDPEREALDAKLNARGKIEPHEIASKTQMFTERYMVDWLLQNSLGPMWLAMCKKHGWTAEVEANGTLAGLEARRVDWRAKRDAKEVELTDLMPLHSEAERRWAYYVPQPIPAGAVSKAPESVRELKLLDPAVGSGHFLVVALDLLIALYREEGRHRGEGWGDRESVERILESNLFGIDLDPRAVQIAAAALWLKARQISAEARPERLNLVASNLRLGGLKDDDPALVELRSEVERETGIPGELTNTLVHALRGADSLGSLLKIDRAVEEALDAHERTAPTRYEGVQTGLFDAPAKAQQGALVFEREEARATLVDRLEEFLRKHTSGDDLGLRLRGEQLAAGVRFVRMVREEQYDLVVANPPYQGTSKMADSGYIDKVYPLGKADLYAAFLLRGLELVREGGVSSMLTMRNWMFIKQYSRLREELLERYDLRTLNDLGTGAFSARSMDDVISSASSVIQRLLPTAAHSVGVRAAPLVDPTRDASKPAKCHAALACQNERFEFAVQRFLGVPESPLIYWWDLEMLRKYQSAPLVGVVAPATFGATTGNNARFVRFFHEVGVGRSDDRVLPASSAPFINGAKGRVWVEDLRELIAWHVRGLAYRILCETSVGANFRSPHRQFRRGVAFSTIGANFSARVHRFPSVFGNAGSSIFPADLAGAVCAMNSSLARTILASLNPTVNFEVGDVNRLPLFPIADADVIFAHVEAAFGVHESHREPSVEFKSPGPSPWRTAQAWAQLAVDRPECTSLPPPPKNSTPSPPPIT